MSNRPKVELKGKKAQQFVDAVTALSESSLDSSEYYGFEAGVLEATLEQRGSLTAADVERAIGDAIVSIYAKKGLHHNTRAKLEREVTINIEGAFQEALTPGHARVSPRTQRTGARE